MKITRIFQLQQRIVVKLKISQDLENAEAKY